MKSRSVLVIVFLLLSALAQAQDLLKGMDALEVGDYAEALSKFRPLAEQGNAIAQYNLGSMYSRGAGVPQDDAEAVKWFRLAAEQGIASAQYNLGVMHVRGDGVPKSDAEAVKWFRLAAEQGFASAQFQLGNKFYFGNGVPQDYAKAHKWFNLAASQGHEMAAEARESLSELMTPAQIAEAQKLAREWMEDQ